MLRLLSVKAMIVIVSVLTVAGFGMATQPWLIAAQDCEDMVCASEVACGGQGGQFVAPPGPMSMCSEDQQGQECEWCDGENPIRLCAPLGTGGRECNRVDEADRTTCGNPKTGICTKASAGGVTYYYCDDDGGNGTGSCESQHECDGDQECSPKS